MTTFTRITQTVSASDGALGTPSTTTVTGSAIRVRGLPETYRKLGLIDSESPTLFFTPTTYGETPLPGDTVVWPVGGTKTYTVQDVNPIAPDGVVIAARVVIVL